MNTSSSHPAHHPRSRAVTRAALASIVLRVATIASTLVATGVAARMLDGSGLTLWFVLLSLVGLQGLGDLGLWSRMTTAVAEIRDPFGAGAEQVARLYHGTVRTTIRAGIAVAMAGVTVTALTLGRTNRGELRVVLAFILVFAAGIPVQAPLRLLYALQRGATANLAIAAANLVTLGGVTLLYLMSADDLTAFTILTTSTALLSGGLAWLVVRASTPFHRFSAAATPNLRSTLSESWPYIAVAAASVVAFSSDQVLLAWLATDSDVAEYGTTYRIFTMIPVTVYLGAQALWPATASARSGGDRDWIRTTTRRVLGASLALTGVCVALLLALGGPLIKWWTGGLVRPGALMLVACSAYALVTAIWSPLHFVLMGRGRIRLQANCMLLMAPLNIVVSAVLIKPFGAAGPVIGSATVFSVAVVVPYVVASRDIFFSKSYKPSANRAPASSPGSTP